MSALRGKGDKLDRRSAYGEAECFTLTELVAGP